jgi:phage-related protein
MNFKGHEYKILFYKSSSGREVVIELIDQLDTILKARVRNAIRLLREHGLQLMQTQMVKKLHKKPDVYELRIVGDSQLRLVFLVYTFNTFIVISVFKKKTKKTPINELKICIKRAKEFI